jgi:putative PEP-CTERM system histidine kinase
MSSGTSVLAAWSYGSVGVVFSAFSLWLVRLGYARAPRGLTPTSLLAAISCSALWGWFSFADLYSSQVGFRFFAAIADVARYACWYACLLSFLGHLGPEGLSSRGGRRFAATAAVLVAAALLVQGSAALDVGFGRQSRVVMLSAMALSIFAGVLVEQLYRNVREDSRWNAKPLCLGLTGMFLFDMYMYSQAALFGHIEAEARAVRGFVHVLMAPLLLLSISRRRDWISKLRVSRKAAFHSATLLIAGVYLVFVAIVGYYVRFFGGEWGRALQLAIIFAALVVLLVVGWSGTVRAKLKVLLGKHFFQYRYDYREEWLRFTQTLSAQESPHDMGQRVVQGLADMLESPAGLLWTRPVGGKTFHNVARWNMAAQLDSEEADSSFCGFLASSGWVIELGQYRTDPQHYEGLVLPGWLTAMPQAWLVVPLRVADELTGFVLLASPRTRMDVNWEVNDLLKTAGRQAASFLAQMQATEALLEVRKFDAFNRMSAFVVHDLKNIVTQLSLMMKNAKRLQANPEFQQDMLMTVENSLDRMRQLMMQLREGSTPAGTAFGVDLPETLRRIAELALSKGRRLEMDVTDRITTRGDAQRLERVVGHVVQNALDATERSGTVSVRLDRHGGQARIEVTDTGHGMSQDFIRDRLFKPFQTTKPAGMGIGAYESYQYINELGGSIDVQSEPDKGTRVVVLLPLFEAQNESDLHMLKAS